MMKKLLPIIMVFGAVLIAADVPVYAVERTARVGVSRAAPTTRAGASAPTAAQSSQTAGAAPASTSAGCRDTYRACMDDFCLMDETEGERCACSNQINASKSLIKQIQDIGVETDKIYADDVEREKLGAKARLVFGESAAAKKIDLMAWLNDTTTTSTGVDLGADSDIGDALYEMAAKSCASRLAACGEDADMEKQLYSRVITQNCRNFDTYLKEQKTEAERNKRTAEAAVRSARASMLDSTNKYNRGECLIAYRSCIADKGGCGANFENCLDAALLARRANACENVLDQCLAVKSYVVTDWEAESRTILKEAAQFADKNKRATCLAQIDLCLEDSCSKDTSSACLTDVKVAAGICPIITECNNIIPGLQNVVNDNLKFLRTRFCQNDVTSCIQDKCGKNFDAPECMGRKSSDIVAFCPQTMFPSCKGENQYNIIVSSVMFDMDFKMLANCTNYFAEQLGGTCGVDMSCLPASAIVSNLKAVPNDLEELRASVTAEARRATSEFFKKFEKDVNVAACKDAAKPAGKKSLGASIFESAKIIGEIGAESRAMRALDLKIAELAKAKDVAEAEKLCVEMYKVESDPKKKEQNYAFIKSVSFEPSLRNCHVCRVQQVCEQGGESKETGAAKGVAGGLAAGASAGTMISPGWGTAIGGVVGAVGMGIIGGMSSGEKTFCQQVEGCEDINM